MRFLNKSLASDLRKGLAGPGSPGKIYKVAFSAEIKELNEEDRSFLAVASDATQDHSEDIIEVEGWDLSVFLSNPVVPWSHNYYEPPIARAAAIMMEEGQLRFRPQFVPEGVYPFADLIYNLYKTGFLKGFSVGFFVEEYEPIDSRDPFSGWRIKKAKLLEISACLIPNNPSALIMPGKTAATKTTDGQPADLQCMQFTLQLQGNILKSLQAKVQEIESQIGLLCAKQAEPPPAVVPPEPAQETLPEDITPEFIAVSVKEAVAAITGR